MKLKLILTGSKIFQYINEYPYNERLNLLEDYKVFIYRERDTGDHIRFLFSI